MGVAKGILKNAHIYQPITRAFYSARIGRITSGVLASSYRKSLMKIPNAQNESEKRSYFSACKSRWVREPNL